jgi:hypothetical protein
MEEAMSTKKMLVILGLLSLLVIAAQSPFAWSDLLKAFSGHPEVKVEYSIQKYLSGGEFCQGIVRMPYEKRIEEFASREQLDQLGPFGISRYENSVYTFTIPMDFCLPPGKSPNEGETNNSGTAFGNLAPVVVPKPSPWTANAVAMAGLIILLILLILIVAH